MRGCRPLSDAEVRAVIAEFKKKDSQRDLAFFVFGILTGRRVSQILKLKIKDVYKHGRVIEYVEFKADDTKGKKGEVIPLHPDVRAVLADYLEELRAGGKKPKSFLFQSRRRGNTAMSRQRAWQVLKEAFEECGIYGKTGTHSMRKTFGNQVFELLGRNLFDAALAMGHADPKSTVSYLQPSRELVEGAFLAQRSIYGGVR